MTTLLRVVVRERGVFEHLPTLTTLDTLRYPKIREIQFKNNLDG